MLVPVAAKGDAVARYSRAKTRRIAIITIASLIAILAICATVVAVASEYNATLVRVYDGDTIVARVDIWPRITAEVSIRLRGVQAPEIGWRAGSACEREAAEEAKRFVVSRLPARFVVIEVDEGAYPGRVIADVIIDGVSLSDLLLTHGHAIPWNGKGRAPRWVC